MKLSSVIDLEGVMHPGTGEPAGGDSMPRLGVSWTNDGVGKGVGSELDPAMAALVMASHDSSPAQDKFDDVSPRLSGKPPFFLWGAALTSL